MHLDNTAAITSPVLGEASSAKSTKSSLHIVDQLQSKAVLKAWRVGGDEYKKLLTLCLQLSDAEYGYAVLRSGKSLLLGVQSGTKLNDFDIEGSFFEALRENEDADFVHFSGESLVSFRQNPLLLDQPEIQSVFCFALKDLKENEIGCLVLASNSVAPLSDQQQASCLVIVKQLTMQLEFCRKVDELRTSQTQLLQINTELRRFASVAAHDLRSPLRAMGSFAGLLRRRLKHKLSPEELEYVDHIRSGATRLSAMVEGILNLAKANHEDYSKYENIDMPTLVAEVADLIDPDQHHIIDFEGEQRRIKTSLPAVKQVLMNLVSNAVKYHHLPSGKIIVSAIKDEVNYTIRVKDNGPGIAKEDQELVFEAFVTGSETPRVPGTGLGLALVRSLTTRLGGSLTLISKLGEGSTFEVKLPIKVH